jgi:hypothetical protein
LQSGKFFAEGGDVDTDLGRVGGGGSTFSFGLEFFDAVF